MGPESADLLGFLESASQTTAVEGLAPPLALALMLGAMAFLRRAGERHGLHSDCHRAIVREAFPDDAGNSPQHGRNWFGVLSDGLYYGPNARHDSTRRANALF